MSQKPVGGSRVKNSAKRKVAESPPVEVWTVDDEDVLCPLCGSPVFSADEPTLPCPHLAFVYSWNDGFESATDAVLAWWTSLYDSQDEDDRFEDPDDLSQCPHIQYLIVHTSHGVACGPVAFSTSLGFSKT